MRDFNREILIVEDEIKAGEELKEMLEFRGCNVSLETSGESAINKVYNTEKELGAILMDLLMPGEIDGIDAVRQIQHEYPQIPIILVTAYADNESYQRRIKEENLKIVGVVDKPIFGDNEKKLLSLIDQELKMQIRKKIEDQLSSDSLTHIIQRLLKEFRPGFSFTLLVEVVKDIEKTQSSYLLNMDEVWPYLNFMSYQNMKDELDKKYPNQFVAFLDGEMLGHDPNRDRLIKTVYKKHNRTDIFITEIAEDEVIKIRRPMKIIS